MVALFIIGIAFIFNALTTYLKRQSIISKYEQTKAVVIDVVKNADSTSIYPVIQFKTIDNQRVKYRAMNEKALHKHVKGDTILLYYDLINPQTMYIPSAGKNTDLGIIGVLGFFICLPTLAFFFVRIRNASIAKKWRAEGKKIKATVVAVEPLPQLKKFGFTPYMVVCEGTPNNYSGQNLQFKSPLIWTDPSGSIAVNQTIDVYVDLQSNSKYIIDFQALQNNIALFYVQ